VGIHEIDSSGLGGGNLVHRDFVPSVLSWLKGTQISRWNGDATGALPTGEKPYSIQFVKAIGFPDAPFPL